MTLSADLILHNGKVMSLDRVNTVHQAVAIWNGRILATGTDADIVSLGGVTTSTIDLQGRCVTPGIIDSHCHPDHHAMLLERWYDIGWPSIKSVQDILDMVAAEHRKLPGGEWFLGFGYNDQKCGGYPSRDQLDAIAPDRPVWLYRTDSHIVVVNSALLSAFDIDENTADPPHGQYDRDPDGHMTGLLREMAAWNLNAQIEATFRVEDYMKGLAKLFPKYLEQGVTSLHNSLTRSKAIDAYQRLRSADRLGMRIGIILDGRDEAMVDAWLAAGVKTGFGDEWIRVVGVEWCPDCSTSGRTAAYYNPYVGESVVGEPVPNYGMLLYEADELIPKVVRAHQAGLRVCVEGLGDRGIDFALDAIEAALEARPADDHRSRVEHCCCVTPQILDRIKRLGVVDSSATGFMYSLGDAYIDNRGEAEMKYMWPHRSLIDAGIHVAGHSDAPVCDINPWEIIGAMVTRKTDSGRRIGPDEAVTIEEALRAYTNEGAYIGFEEHIKGSIEPGKLADLAVLRQDPFELDPEAIKEMTVDTTILNGEVVFER